MGLRVTAGYLKNLRLKAPDTPACRPAAERVRQAVFSSLAQRGLLQGASVLDLFAGTGVVAIEAMSRGAASAVAVESDRRVFAVLCHNVGVAGLEGKVVPVRAQVESFLSHPELWRYSAFDIAFADPPYGYPKWAELLARVPAERVVAEVSNRDDPDYESQGFVLEAEKSFGQTRVLFLLRSRKG
jgi:16S rRNA (guanine966-N2)-methyltransferase